MAKPEWHTIIYNMYLYTIFVLVLFCHMSYACFGLYQERDHDPGNILRLLIDVILKFKLHIKELK